jgi:Skp family chaperone for outer membrane proteins
MRSRAVILGMIGLAFWCQPLAAQTAAPSTVEKTSVVTLDQEQLTLGSKYGQALQAQFEAETAALQAENRKIEAELEAEERALTAKRAGMDSASFRLLAEAFDKKANDLRTAQDVKSRNLTKRREERLQKFFYDIKDLIGETMIARGAVVTLKSSATVMSLSSIDITAEVIALIDQQLGDGSKAP